MPDVNASLAMPPDDAQRYDGAHIVPLEKKRVRKDRMSLEQFMEVRKKLPKRMKPQSVELAYDVLVMGMSIPEAAKRQGLTRERGRVIVNRVLAAEQEVPATWQRVDEFLPPEMARVVKRMAEEARAELERDRQKDKRS
jgi:hypothetical protein